jgi:hypothetical protein
MESFSVLAPNGVISTRIRRQAADKRPGDFLKLDHLRRMTDDTGVFQHAIFTVPNYREATPSTTMRAR